MRNIINQTMIITNEALKEEAIAYIEWMDKMQSKLVPMWRNDGKKQPFPDFCLWIWNKTKKSYMAERLSIENQRLALMN